MDTLSVLVIVLVVAAIALCGLAAYALVIVVGAMRSMRTLADDLDGRLVPLLDKLDVTVDAANAELLRIDGIVTVFEDASAKVSATTAAVHDAVSAPREAVENLGEKLRHAWKHRKSHDEAEHAGPPPQESAEQEPLDSTGDLIAAVPVSTEES